MKNKKIWLILGCLLLALCLSLVFQISMEKKASGEQMEDNRSFSQESAISEEPKVAVVPLDADLNSSKDKQDTINKVEEAELLINGSKTSEQEGPLENNDKITVKEEMPKAVDVKEADSDKNSELKCTLSVDCTTVLNNLDKLNSEKTEIVPGDGIIFSEQEVIFYEGETVFDVLLREMKKNKIHMEYIMSPLYDSNYIEGIGNLYELDGGELSGWVYMVNGLSPSYGSSSYKLSHGDVVQWKYTFDLGRDVSEESESINEENTEEEKRIK